MDRLSMDTVASRLSANLLTPSTTDDPATSTGTDAVTPPSVSRLRDAYRRASAPESLPVGVPKEPASWDRRSSLQLETEEEKSLSDRIGLMRQGIGLLEEQMSKVFRDLPALRLDVDTVMLQTSKAEAQQAEANRSWSTAQADLAKESMDLLIRVTEDQKSLKEAFTQESALRAEMEEENRQDLAHESALRAELEERIKQEATSRTEMAESIAKDRERADSDIVSSIRQVVEQTAAFREVVLKEAGEQRAALAKEMESNLQTTFEHSMADLRSEVEKSLTASQQKHELLEARLTSYTQEMRHATKIVEAQCLDTKASVDRSIRATEDSGAKLHSLSSIVEELNARVQDVQVRASDASDDVVALRKAVSEDAERRATKDAESDESMAVFAENLKDEIKERTLLNGRIRSEADQRTKVTSAVWLEVANVQQQVAELRESVRLQVAELRESGHMDDVQGQLSRYKEAAETHAMGHLSSLEDWKHTTSTAFEQHKGDMSALRDKMTSHMTWVAETHEAAVGELRQKVASDAEQIKELYRNMSTLQDQLYRNTSSLQEQLQEQLDARAVDRKSPRNITRARSTSSTRATTPTPIKLLTRLSSHTPTVPAMTQVQRPVSPLGNGISEPRLLVNSYAASAGGSAPTMPSTLLAVGPAVVARTTVQSGASISVSASGGPVDASFVAAAGKGVPVLRRVPSAGALSARFIGPPRSDRGR